MFGHNDAALDPPELYRENLLGICCAFNRAGITAIVHDAPLSVNDQVVALSPGHLARRESFHAVNDSIADGRDILRGDTTSRRLMADDASNFCSDHVHYSRTGNARLGRTQPVAFRRIPGLKDRSRIALTPTETASAAPRTPPRLQAGMIHPRLVPLL